VITSCIPTVERSLVELASFIRTQTNQTSGKIFVTVNALQGSGLVLNLNESEDLSVSSSGEVSFTTTLSPRSNYTVTIKTQPTSPFQVCSVSGGTGTLISGDIKSVLVNCDEATYSLGGTISSLAGSGLVISNNGTDSVSISANGSFAFTTTYKVGTTYSLSVSSSPTHPTQTCTISNGSGTFSAANISSVSISCTTTARAVRATVTGIGSGTLVLNNNTSDSLSISSNGSFVFNNDVTIGASYAVTITSAPTSHTCALSGATGTIAGTDATVTVNCFSIVAQTPESLSVLRTNQSISLRFSASVTASSCTLGAGNLTTGGTISYSVSTTSITDDTLTISTTTTWNPASVSQQITCTSAAGNSLANGTHTFRYTIPSSVSYVSSASGADGNSGTSPAAPVRTIQRGINVLGACGTPPCVVYVEDGTYEAEDFGQNFITLSVGVSLYGGYTAGSSFATRNASARLTLIQNSAPTVCGASAIPLTPCKTILVPGTVTNNTFIDGFRITGASTSSDSTAISIVGGKPIISNNTISGGSSNNAAGIIINNFGGSSAGDGSQGAIVNNTISGGSCTVANCITAGIVSYSTTAGLFPYVQINTITGGSCATATCKTYGFYLGTGNSVDLNNFRYNTISGGTVSPASTGTESTGIYINDGSTTGKLYGNTINGGTAANTSGIYLGVSMPLVIGDSATKTGNAIFGGTSNSTSYGVRLGSGGSLYSNSIHAGNVIAPTASAITYGVQSSSGVVTLNGNRIYGGSSVANGSVFSASYGVALVNLGAATIIVGNHISAGISRNNGTNNAYAYGLHLAQVFNTPLSVYNNMIDGGTSSLAVSTNTSESHGIFISNSTIVSSIYYNTIFSGSAEDISTPITYSNTNSRFADIKNNILYTQVGATNRICLNHFGTTEATNLSALSGNVFYGCTTLVKFPTISADQICVGGVVSSSGCPTTNISTPSSLNVYVDPVLSTTTTTYNMSYRSYSTSSPCTATQISNVLGAPVVDSLGAARPGSVAGISAGALEYNGSCL